MRWLSNQHGFTLAELVVVAAVMGFLMAGVFALQRQGQEAYLLGSSRVETQQNARVALDLMTRELRTASGSAAPPNGIVSIPTGGTDIKFWDQSGANTIRYCWSSSLAGCVSTGQRQYLNRSLNDGPPTTVTGGVQSLALSYYDKSTAPYAGTDQTKVWVIKIGLVTKTEKIAAPHSPGDQNATMESTIKLRATLS